MLEENASDKDSERERVKEEKRVQVKKRDKKMID